MLITGTLVEAPDYRDNYTNLRLDVEKVDTGDRDLPVHGLILVRASNNQIFHYGDRLRLRGKLKTPPENEDFSYRDYLAAQHIHSYMSSAEVTVLPGKGGNLISAAVYALKEKSLDNIYRCSLTLTHHCFAAPARWWYRSNRNYNSLQEYRHRAHYRYFQASI